VRQRQVAGEGGSPHDDALGALLARLGHELRTPVGVIAGFTELLLSEEAGPLAPEQRRYLEEVRRSCQRLARFVSELGTADLGATQPVHPERASFLRLAEGVATSSKPLLDRRRQNLKVRVASEAEQARLDAARVEQVLVNLIANASRYAPEGGSIELEAERVAGAEGPELRVSVTDDGPGVRAGDRERIFEPWTRLGSGGSPGLGLAICRTIVAAHGGRIQVEDAPGRGARFVFTLPGADA
jgi:signal transduction histidine kinase